MQSQVCSLSRIVNCANMSVKIFLEDLFDNQKHAVCTALGTVCATGTLRAVRELTRHQHV